jgi:hypothetical protein
VTRGDRASRQTARRRPPEGQGRSRAVLESIRRPVRRNEAGVRHRRSGLAWIAVRWGNRSIRRCHDAEGDALHTIRYGRMPKGDVRGLCRGLVRDVTAMRAQRPDLKVAYLSWVASATAAPRTRTAAPRRSRAAGARSPAPTRIGAVIPDSATDVTIVEPHPVAVDIIPILRPDSRTNWGSTTTKGGGSPAGIITSQSSCAATRSSLPNVCGIFPPRPEGRWETTRSRSRPERHFADSFATMRLAIRPGHRTLAASLSRLPRAPSRYSPSSNVTQ